MLASTFTTDNPLEQTKFNVALRGYLNTRSFYHVHKFFMCKDDLQYSF